MNIKSLSLLDKTVQVTSQMMRLLGGLLERELTREDPEWAAARASLTVSEKPRIKPSRRQHQKKRKGVQNSSSTKLVSSIPQSILMKTSYKEKEQKIGTQQKTVIFQEPGQELIKVGSKNPEQQNFVRDVRCRRKRSCK